MVVIVTGKINDFKTTKMCALYEQDYQGDGFVSIKTMRDDRVYSYHAMRLSTGERRLLVLRDSFFNDEFTIACQIGPYLFNQETLDWMEQNITIMLKDNIKPIYLDEVGVLELSDEGTHPILVKLLASKTPLVLSMREDLIEPLTKKYQWEIEKIIITSQS